MTELKIKENLEYFTGTIHDFQKLADQCFEMAIENHPEEAGREALKEQYKAACRVVEEAKKAVMALDNIAREVKKLEECRKKVNSHRNEFWILTGKV